jgi:hypothetical protein
MKQPILFLLVVSSSLAVLFACSKKEQAAKSEEPEMEYMVFGEYVSPGDSLPRLRYFEDNQVSLNDRCAVRKVRLNPKMSPVYVNGQPIGFC